MNDPLLREVLPEERLAKVVLALAALNVDFKTLSVTELAALLSPYSQIELMEAAHQERVMCLSDFYNLREKLVERERQAFQKKAELLLQISLRPEAGVLGLRIVEKNVEKREQ